VVWRVGATDVSGHVANLAVQSTVEIIFDMASPLRAGAGMPAPSAGDS
jgi:hypothetical protein